MTPVGAVFMTQYAPSAAVRININNLLHLWISAATRIFRSSIIIVLDAVTLITITIHHFYLVLGN